jgi:hypothetical protein
MPASETVGTCTRFLGEEDEEKSYCQEEQSRCHRHDIAVRVDIAQGLSQLDEKERVVARRSE